MRSTGFSRIVAGPDDFNGYGHFYVRLYWNGCVFQWIYCSSSLVRRGLGMLRFLLRRLAHDARHHGRYEPEGKLCCEEASPIADFGSGMYLDGFAGDEFSFSLLWWACSRCLASWSVWTRGTVRRSSFFPAMACARLVLLVRC